MLIQKIRVVITGESWPDLSGVFLSRWCVICRYCLKFPKIEYLCIYKQGHRCTEIFLQDQALCWGNVMLHSIAVTVEATEPVLNCVSWVEYRWHPWHYSKEITESDTRNPTEAEGNGKKMAPCRPSRPLCVSYLSNLNVICVSLSLLLYLPNWSVGFIFYMDNTLTVNWLFSKRKQLYH